MELSKEQYEELKKLLGQMEGILKEAQGNVPEDKENAAYWNKRMGILAEVMLKGGIVTEDDWGTIGKNSGYDRRGLGGYFVGDASMTKIGNNRRAITEKGTREVLDWLNGNWGIKPTKEQSEKYKGLL